MKKLFILCFILIFSLFISVPYTNAYVSVKGYTKSNGTYVAPHVRSNPNGLKYDNYSYTPSQGLYNKTYGTRGSEWDTPTYITDPDYYLGKSLYESNKTPTFITPTKVVLPIKDVSYVTKTWVENNPNSTCDQATFLRAKEKSECNTYKLLKNNYTWNTTVKEFDNKHYIYNSETKITSSCPDGYQADSKTISGKTTISCIFELPIGCLNNQGYSITNGLSCSTGNTCSPYFYWNGDICAKK